MNKLTQFLKAWGERYGLTLEQVKYLRKLGLRVGKTQEACMNGASPELTRDNDQAYQALAQAALHMGFDAVDPRVGIYPQLIKDGYRIDLPLD